MFGQIGAEEMRKACDSFFRRRGMPIKTFRDGIEGDQRKGRERKEKAKEEADERDEQSLQRHLDGDGP